MRCIGASDPPCVRCLKSNRECIIKLPNRQQRPSPSSRSNAATHPPAPISPNPLIERPSSSSVNHASPSRTVRTDAATQLDEPSPGLVLEQTNLPSIFSSSPISIASTRASDSEGLSSGMPASYARLELDQVSHSTILDLVEL
jgi:hypothetical protein